MYVYIYVYMAEYSSVLQCLPGMNKALNLTSSTTVYTYKCSICICMYIHIHIYTCVYMWDLNCSLRSSHYSLSPSPPTFCFQSSIAWKRREEEKSQGVCNWLCSYVQKMAELCPLHHCCVKLLIAVHQVKSIWQYPSFRWEVLSSVLFAHFLFFRSYFPGTSEPTDGKQMRFHYSLRSQSSPQGQGCSLSVGDIMPAGCQEKPWCAVWAPAEGRPARVHLRERRLRGGITLLFLPWGPRMLGKTSHS